MSKFAGMDLNNAINVFTKTLMWKITEGHPVEDEEIAALNSLRENAGLKPIDVPADAGKQPPKPKAERQAPGYSPDPNEKEFTSIVVNGRRVDAQMLPDNTMWTNRFDIKSESSNRLYRIAQHKSKRYWACSCPSWITRRRCKHLEAMGLPGGEEAFEARLKSASTTVVSFKGDKYSDAEHKKAAEMIHSDAELSKLMEPAVPAIQGEAHIEGPEAGQSNDEFHANTHEENGVPVTDGDLVSPERQNVTAIKDAIEGKSEMEIGKPIKQKQKEVEIAEEVRDEKAMHPGATEVSAKPGTQVIINIGSKTADTVQAEGIGGEDDSKVTSGQGGGMFGGTDLEGPSFKDNFHVGFTFRGTRREASFSTFKEAHMFIKNASEKFGKVASDWAMKCPQCGGSASKQTREDSYHCAKCGWDNVKSGNKKASVKNAGTKILESSGDPVKTIIDAVLADLKSRGMIHDSTPQDVLARAVSTLKTKIKKQRRGDVAIYSINVSETGTKYQLEAPAGGKDDFAQNPYKFGAADPVKRNLVLEVLKQGPKTTGEIEKALGGGKYTNLSWPILQELAKDGLVGHKQMRWSLKASKTAEWKGWNETMPVQVVSDKGSEQFPNLAAAKQKYPTLDPQRSTSEFTWAMRGEINGQPAIRFETWPAYEIHSASAKKKAYAVGKVAFGLQTRVSESNKADLHGQIVSKLNAIFQKVKQENPQGYMDSFEQQLPSRMMDIAQEMGLQMDYTPEDDTYILYDQAASGTKGKSYEELTQKEDEGGLMSNSDADFRDRDASASLKSAMIRVTSVKNMPRKGTPEYAELKIAIQTLKMPEAIADVMGGPGVEHAHQVLAQYGLKWDEAEYMAGGKGVKKAGEGVTKTVEEQVEKEAGFNFFFPGQVVKEFYPELQHEIVDYPNANNSPMSGAGNPEIVGDGGHELEGMLDEALDTNLVEMIQLPADVGALEEVHISADYSSTSPAGGMGIGRDGKPEVLEGAPLRKENDIRGGMFTDEFYGQYEGIPGAAMAVASKTAAEGDEAKQFALFLKRVCGEIAATLVAAFKVTSRPLLDKIPGIGELQLDTIEQGTQQMAMGSVVQGGRVQYLLGKLNERDNNQAINDALAQAAGWKHNADIGLDYEVFVRPETIDTDSMKMKYKFVCGTRESGKGE